MTCKKASSLISAYLDNELAPDEKVEVRAHLFACSECSAELESERLLKSMLASMRDTEPSADFEERLVRRVMGEPERASTPARSWLPLAAAVFMVAFLGWFAIGAMRSSSVPTKPNGQFEIARDQAYEAAGDPTQTVPILVTSTYGAP